MKISDVDVDYLAFDTGQVNTTYNLVVSEYVFEEFEKILFILDLVIMLASFVCNVCVVYFICGQKRSRTTNNITIVSIAVADISLASFVMPAYLAISKNDSVSAEVAMFLCKLSKYFWRWCKTVTVYSIMAMVIDRYFKVKHPYKTSAMAGRCMFFLNFVWFFGASYNIWEIVLNTSQLITVPLNNTNITVRRCVASGNFGMLQGAFMYGDFLIVFLFPLFTMLALFFGMVRHICGIKGDGQQQAQAQSVVGRRRVLMSMALFVLFFSCQLPLEVQETMTSFDYSSNPAFRSAWSLSLTKMLETVSFMQGFLNITAYASCSAELHKQIWRGCCQADPSQTVSGTRHFSIVAATDGNTSNVLLTSSPSASASASAAVNGSGSGRVCIEAV